MLRSIRWFTRVGALACAMSAVACAGPSLEGAAPDSASGARERTLAGAWRWVATEREGETVRPVDAADRVVLVLGAWGTYREYTGGSEIRGRYAFARGHLFQLQDTSFIVLMMDSSRFFPRPDHSSPAIAIRSFRGDTLIFSGTGADASFHTFVSTELPR